MIDLTKINPKLSKIIPIFTEKCFSKGIHVLVYSGYRSSEQQGAIWLQGRFPVKMVNEARVKAGMKEISELDNRRIVTKAKPGQSKHETGEAFDCVLMLNGKPDWGVTAHHLWQHIGKIGEELGLVWGKHFSNRDWCHFELKNK